LPEAQNTERVKKEERDFLVLGIGKDGTFYVDGEESTRTTLRDKLEEQTREDPERRIRVDADRQAPIRAVAEALDLLRIHDLENFGIQIFDPEKAGP